MRNRLMMMTAAPLLAFASLAMAQPAPATPTDVNRWRGAIDFGARATSATGDSARYERYRDLRSGVFSKISFEKETDQYALKAKADNIGYHDQRYQANYEKGGQLKIAALWDSIPLNYSYLSSTPWVEESRGVFTLDAAARLLVQNGAPGVVGVPTTPAQLATPSIYRSLAKPFDIQARRDTAAVGGTFAPKEALSFMLTFSSTKKSGHEPKGASFAFSVADQLPLPLENRTNDLTAAAEWLNKQGMIRVAWDSSWFNNDVHEYLFDNPVRATDTNPIDASGYSNGRGAARSRMAAPPSNSLNKFSAMGLYKMPGHSALNGQISFTLMKQNDALIPWTSNQVIASPATYQTFPNLARLPRSNAEAEVRGVNALLSYTTRPNRYVGFTMRYRYNDHQNRTPVFDGTEYARLDAVPEETGGETEHFNITQGTLDLNGTFNLPAKTALRIGYTVDDVKRTGREFSTSTDYALRTTLDMLGTRYVTMRLTYENVRRFGTGFSEQSLEDGGFQPGLRTYDVSNRDRNRTWLVVTVSPSSIVDLNLAVAAGNDTYKGEGHDFGLLDNTNRVYNASISVTPNSTVHVGANYGRDRYVSNQSSRNANPPGTDYGSWSDPNRIWYLGGDETVNNASLYVDLTKAFANTDIRLAYDYSDSDNAYVHSGPRIQELATNKALSSPASFAPVINPATGLPFTIPSPCAAGLTSCFEALPKITNKWQRAAIVVTHMFTPRVGLSFSYWYEKFDVSDYATLDLPGQPGTPRIDYLGSLTTGYGNRPYKGSTGSFRFLYLF